MGFQSSLSCVSHLAKSGAGTDQVSTLEDFQDKMNMTIAYAEARQTQGVDL